MKKWRFLIIALAVIFCAGASNVDAKAKSKSRAKKGGKARSHRALKTQSTDEYKKVTYANEISPAVAEAIASGDLNGAIILMRDEKKVTPKILHISRELARLYEGEGKKPPKSQAHKVYQNTAIGYHNLYLFLKARELDRPDFFDKAHDYYQMARKAGDSSHKADCEVLDAALIATSGDIDGAKKKFEKIKKTKMRNDFESMAYLATYYAAIRDPSDTVKYINAAHELNPEATIGWLTVADDFYMIQDDPDYKSLLVSWKAADVGRQLVMEAPKKAKKKKEEAQDETSSFRPQKVKKHYADKKVVTDKKTKKTKKSSKSTKKTKSTKVSKSTKTTTPATVKKKK